MVKEKGVHDLFRVLVRMLDKQTAMLIASKSRALETFFSNPVMSLTYQS